MSDISNGVESEEVGPAAIVYREIFRIWARILFGGGRCASSIKAADEAFSFVGNLVFPPCKIL